MALIYSRPRIKLPKFCFYHARNSRNGNKKNKIFKFIILIIILIIISISIIKAIGPVFNKLCSDQAKSIATIICNNQTTECMKGYEYSDFINIHTDDNKNIVMLEANMININILVSNIAEKIQLEINKTQNEDIYISLGSFTGINLLSGRGPKIPIKISTIGNVTTDFKSEFIEQGVNQTLHRLYLEIECEISILTPFNTINEKINNQLIIAENIIVGKIPSTYYHLEGMESGDLMEVIE